MSSVPENAPQPRKRPITLVYHRGGRSRTLRLDTKVALAVGIALVVLGVWYLVATIYLVFRDDLLSSLVARHTQVQYAYEDRIAALRTSIDRLTSRQLIDQDGVEGKVQELMSRQAQLETRQAMVAALASHAESMPRLASTGAPPAAPTAGGRTSATPPALGGPLPAPEIPAGAAAFAPVAKPQPVSEFGALRGSGAAAAPARAATPAQAPPVKPAPTASGDAGAAPVEAESPPQQRQRQGALPSIGTQAPVAARLLRMSAAQSIAEDRQLTTLDAYSHRFRMASSRLQGVLVEVGLDSGRFVAFTGAATAANQGGPFVPVKVDPASGPFEASVDRVQRSMVEADRLQRIVDTLPLRRPLPGDSETTSHFGYRADPFTRSMAMHTGIDFRDDYGAAVRATAAGVVVTAEYSGGYGNLVEIDHGNGLTTRYAHLSQILVGEGQKVAGGGVVGRLGSTGRSTGPHLHYETRVDGDPVDPMRYLRAAARLGRS
jgi:murein DD-endopeptidase MepM/ murein hydrolase activator NlpD